MSMYRFIDNSLSCIEDARDPRYAATLRKTFDHIPPTLFIVAQCDILKDDSYGGLCLLAMDFSTLVHYHYI